MNVRRVAALAGVAVTLATISAQALAAVPSLGGSSPYGAQRGTEVDVRFSGARLGDAQEIFFYEPGITVKELAPEGDTIVKAKLAIAADCRLGLHQLRIRTASGISNLRTFSVGAMPEVSETEPNNDFLQPQKIALDVVVNGVADNEDIDYFAIEAKKGQRITAEIEGLRLGITLLRSVRGHSRFQTLRAGPLGRRAAGAAGLHVLDRGARGRHVYRGGPRDVVRRQRLLCVSPARRTVPATHWPWCPSAASRARR